MTNTNFTVTSEGNASSGATSLNGAIASIDIGGANAAINTHYTITFGNTINLTDGNLLAVNLSSGSSLTIQGGNFLLNGEGNQRGFFVYSGAVDIHNLTIENTQAVGGLGSYYSGGGGGGAGLGGGLFVASAGSVVLDNVSFSGSKATGGNGGYGQQAFINGVGGGGGMGGCGGSGQSSFTGSGVTAGGGGGGLGLSPYNQFGGDAFGGSGRSGIVPGAVGGGSGQNGGSGGAWGGGGGAGGGMNFYTTGGGFNPTNGTYSPGNMHTAAIPGIGGGGGIGGVSGATGQRPNGGFGGGGGGGTAAAPGGGNGGFGGGGGAGINGGGHGGFGGGGGGNANGQGGSGGFGGGHAGSGGGGSFGAGGGGLGAGGDIFVQCGGSLTLEGGTLSGGSVAAGQGGHGGQGNGGVGADYGSGIFIQGNQTITFSPTSGQTTTVSDVIADMTGSQDPSGQTGQGNIVINGGGTVVLDAINTYTGTTTLSAGSTLELANASGAGTSEIEFQSGSTAILRIDGATMPTNTIDDFASGDIIDLRGLAFVTGATASYNSNSDILTVTSNGVTEYLTLTDVQGNGVVAISDGATGTAGTEVEIQDVAPSVSSLAASSASSANFAAAHTVTFTLDTSETVTVAGGTTISLSDGGTATYVSGSGTSALTFTYSAIDAPQALTITGLASGSIEDSYDLSLSIAGTSVAPYTDAVTDSAANVSANFASLDSAVSYISSITLNNGGMPALDLTASEVVNDRTLIGKIVGPYDLVVDDSAANFVSNFASLVPYTSEISSVQFTDSGRPIVALSATEILDDQTLIGKIAGPHYLAVYDSASDIQASFDSLETYASSLAAVAFTDTGTPTLNLTATQVTNDATLLSKMYDAYDLMVTGVTGQAYTSYESVYGAYDALKETTDFNSNGSETITAYVSGLTLTGTAYNDTFYLECARSVTASGGAGNDLFFFGSGFSNSDQIDGGGGSNTLDLDGTYTGSNALTISTSMMSNIQTLGLVTGHSYDITPDAGVVTTGQTLTVSAATLGAGNSLTFDGSALTGGTLTIDAGAGVDELTGGAGTNKFDMAGYFTAADEINGGTGTTTVTLDGDYSGGVTFAATTMVNVDTLDLTTGYSYDLVLNDATVGSGQTMTIQGSSLGAGNGMTIDASAVAAGTLTIDAGAGVDVLTGGAGTNNFSMAGHLTASDEINGGTGTTTVTLDGDYSGGVTFTATTMVNVDTLDLTAGHSYDLVLNDATTGSGQTMTIQGSSLGAGNGMTIDASAVTAGNLTIDAGAGVDDLTGGGATNTFNMGAYLTASDEINGGTGTSTVHLDGDYSGGLTFNATTMVNVDTLDLTAGYSYNLTLNSATVASGDTLTIQATGLSASNSLTLDGSAVDGNLVVHAGSGSSFIEGGLGADQLYAGSGADTFAYAAAADSTGTTFDTISAFNTGSDMIDLAGSLSAVTAIDTAVTTGTLGPTNFTSVLEHDVGAAQLSAYGAVLFTPSSGGYAGNTFLIIDENGVAGYQAGSDLVIELLHGVNLASLSLSNFETAA